jgi:hypothetical protein
VPAEVAPELARLLGFTERPRRGDWSLRAALTRYAQPEPQRVSDLLEHVRRVEFAIKPHVKALERGQEPAGAVVGLLDVIADLDLLGDVLAAWAADPTGERPDAAVDAATADVARRLDELGIPREQRQRPPRQRG